MKQTLANAKTEVYKYLFAFLCVLAIGVIIILIQGGNPIKSFSAIFSGSLIGIDSIARSIRWIIPCIIAGIAATVAFRSGVFNLGIDGQIYIGAFIAAMIGYSIGLPRGLHIPLTIICAGLGGLIFAIIPAVLKLYFRVNEMVTTLMLNYVAILFTEYLAMMFLGFDGSKSPEQVATPPILESAKLKQLFPPYQATTGIFIALGLVIIVHIIYKYTTKGYELKQLGENMIFSRLGGIRVPSMYLAIFLISGFIAGITGAVEIMGPHGKFRAQFATNLGWDGIMIALIARNNPIGVIIVGSIWGILKNGAFAMERMTDTSRLVIVLIQALFVLFITVDFNKLQTNIKKLWNKHVLKRETGGVV
ncbi:ABC transporter permease [Bacillus sp. IITD106]|nr:ABC transporter permease [Bacillus sp. IITD106]